MKVNLKVLIPEDIKDNIRITKITCSNPNMSINKLSSSIVSNYKTFEYEVLWKPALDVGVLKENISFSIEENDVIKTFEIPFRGQFFESI